MATVAGGLLAMTGQASAAVTAVKSSAYGVYGNISLFGGPFNPQGPLPTVTQPAAGSSTGVTATVPTQSLVYGPAVFFRSGTVNLSSKGTPATGSVTSTTSFAATAGVPNTPCRDRTTNDGATSSNTTVTSATAAFTAADVGSDIEGGSIPLGATIASVQSATSATISVAATTTATAVKLVIQNSTYGGIPANATIVSVLSPTSVTISAPATARATGVHLAIASNGTCIYDGQFTADTASTTCTANDTGPATASTHFTKGLLATATDNNQHPTTTVAIADNPAANLTIAGSFKLGSSDREKFTYIFNEQIHNADGSLTVNAVHLKAQGQTAFGDEIFGQSVCGVTRSSTTTAVSSVNPSVFGQPVKFTATVAPAAGTGTPTGTVQFTDNGANLGAPVKLLAGKATSAATSSLTVGSRTVNAVYAGSGRITNDGATHANTTVTSASAGFSAKDVGAAISGSRARNAQDGTTNSNTTVTSATAKFTAADVGANIAGNNIPVNATIVSVQSATSVTISAPATLTRTAVDISITSGIPANATIVSVQSPTSVTISAAATSTASGLPLSIAVPWGFSASTGTLTQTVNKAATTTAVTSSKNPAATIDQVTFTATVAPVAPGAGTRTGTVQFKNAGVNLGSPVALSTTGKATTTVSGSSLGLGSHAITAVYGGSTNFTGSTSAVLTQTVQ